MFLLAFFLSTFLSIQRPHDQKSNKKHPTNYGARSCSCSLDITTCSSGSRAASFDTLSFTRSQDSSCRRLPVSGLCTQLQVQLFYPPTPLSAFVKSRRVPVPVMHPRCHAQTPAAPPPPPPPRQPCAFKRNLLRAPMHDACPNPRISLLETSPYYNQNPDTATRSPILQLGLDLCKTRNHHSTTSQEAYN